MNATGATLVQIWSRNSLLCFCISLFSLHSIAVIVGIFVAPTLYHSDTYTGSSCFRSQDSGCLPVDQSQKAPLGQVVTNFRFPRESGRVSHFSAWNWRVIGSLSLSVTIENRTEGGRGGAEANLTTPPYVMEETSIKVLLRAELDSSQSDESKSWERQAEVHAERLIDCSLFRPLHGSELHVGMNLSTQYFCNLSPLLDLHLPKNGSYIISIQFYRDLSSNLTSNLDEIQLLDSPAFIEAKMTLVVENKEFHKCLFYMKCVFIPFVLTALVFFCTRMYLNDLYISIPDRLLISCALAQIVQNIPTEVLVATWANPYLKLLDELSYVILVCCLCLFWVIFAKDKLARNEPWERNTRYYWKQLILIILSAMTCALFIIYDNGPTLKNPFNNHWNTHRASTISLAFIFALMTLAMIYETYLSVLALKVLVQASIHRLAAARLKIVLLYCFIMSLVTVAGFVLKLAIKLSLNWNHQFFINPIPSQLGISSPMFIGLQAAWNLHIISLLVMLSRHSSGEFITPVKHQQRQVSQILDQGDMDQNSFDEHLDLAHVEVEHKEMAVHLFTLEEEEGVDEEHDMVTHVPDTYFVDRLHYEQVLATYDDPNLDLPDPGVNTSSSSSSEADFEGSSRDFSSPEFRCFQRTQST